MVNYISVSDERLESRDIEGLFQAIEEKIEGLEDYNEDDSIVLRIKLYLDCLSQILIIEHSRNTGVFISSLIGRVYDLAKDNPQEAKETVNSAQFKSNPQLQNVVEKVNYLAKNRFISDKSDWFLLNSRFSHHLQKNLGNLSTMSKGAAYLLAGTAIFGGGIVIVAQSSNEDLGMMEKILKGYVPTTIGSAYMLAPVMSAFKNAFHDYP